MNAKLPAHLKVVYLRDIQEGDSVWVTPWTMFVDGADMLWLNGNDVAHELPGGTATLNVYMKNGEYICNVGECGNYKWENSSNYDNTSLPVTKLYGI